MRPTAEITMGKTMAFHPAAAPIPLPMTRAAQVDSAKDPNKSDPIPATKISTERKYYVRNNINEPSQLDR